MNKLQRILIAVLAAQLVLAVIVFWPRQAATGAGAPLLGIKTDDVTGLTISDDQGKTVVLAKSGDSWTAASAADYPADAAKITPALDKLVAVAAGQPVVQTAASHAQLQVADSKFVRKIELQTAGGAKTLYLGSASGSRATHARLAGQDAVYLARNVATWELTADLLSWINPVYFSVPSADVTGFTVENAQGEVAFIKDAAGAWTLQGLAAGETVNTGAITTLLSQTTSVRLTAPLGTADDPAYGLAQPAATVTLTTKTGDQTKTYTLAVGAKNVADSSYVVKSSESAYYVRVAEFGVKDLVEKGRAGFLQQPTPAPTPAP